MQYLVEELEREKATLQEALVQKEQVNVEELDSIDKILQEVRRGFALVAPVNQL